MSQFTGAPAGAVGPTVVADCATSGMSQLRPAALAVDALGNVDFVDSHSGNIYTVAPASFGGAPTLLERKNAFNDANWLSLAVDRYGTLLAADEHHAKVMNLTGNTYL